MFLFSPRHDLKLVELQPEHAARMLDECAHAECARGGAGVQGGGEVPNLKIPPELARFGYYSARVFLKVRGNLSTPFPIRSWARFRLFSFTHCEDLLGRVKTWIDLSHRSRKLMVARLVVKKS